MRKIIAIIYEGEKTERILIRNLNKIFFEEDTELLPIAFPAGQNIYMLWKRLAEDEFQTDVIEVLREYSKQAEEILAGYRRTDFMEIYLFFDYDGHNNNLGNGQDTEYVLNEMLDTFSDETDMGKLYINYPMVESIRDTETIHKCYDRCMVSSDEMPEYKKIVHDRKQYQDSRKYTKEDWKHFCKIAVSKANCLIHNSYQVPERKEYFETISQREILQSEQQIMKQQNKIAILNSTPLFLLEYYKAEFWNEMLQAEVE